MGETGGAAEVWKGLHTTVDTRTLTHKHTHTPSFHYSLKNLAFRIE